MLRAMLPRFLLIAALLFAQLGGLAHGIAHTLDGRGSDSSVPHDKHCDLCSVYAQLGSAVGSSIIPFSLPEQHNDYSYVVPVSFHSSLFAAYTARAPPYSA